MILEVACPIPVYKTFDYLLPDSYQTLSREQILGRRVLIPFGFKNMVGVVCGIKDQSDAPAGKIKSILSFIDDEPLLNEKALSLGTWLAHRTVCALGEALFALLPPKKNDVKAITQKTSDDPMVPSDQLLEAPLSPTTEQSDAMTSLLLRLKSKKFEPCLLRGLAATGKTEVYMAVIQEVLNQGQRALVLAPEIGLVEQLGAMLTARFGDQKVLLFHSDVSPKKRLEDWWRIKKGEVSVVVGARSTILAPLDNIGVIIIDEEHDTAYKEDRKPRFHVRDVAWERARLHECLLIYGGATPSLEILSKVQAGLIASFEIRQRAVPSEKPVIELIDLKKNKTQGFLSIILADEMAARFRVREQVILFLNRRGFFRYLKCPHCAWIARCPTCGIALVFHKSPGRKKEDKAAGFWCHYCSYVLADAKKCPDCGKKELVSGGFGTERIEDEIKKQFPWVTVARWDRDAVAQRGRQKALFEEFKAGKYDVLIGTQVVAQGFNFPNVTMVGVLDADLQLHIPDFRSAERTFQLITQVAGRAGRKDKTGKVLVQTHHHDHYALHFAAAMDLDGFAAHELKFREELNYPPYRHLIRIVTVGKKAEGNAHGLVTWGDSFQGQEGLAILGPSPVKKFKGKGTVQFQILFKVAPPDFELFLKALRSQIAPHPSDYLIDVDPESLS